ncbi:hypothetical protein ACH470_00250 [Streptomyces bottropensis]|uniref:hypothetical protein n=1 Tax=Streptomyces bottropensis TaxID=42235 RepID=UPI0037B12470
MPRGRHRHSPPLHRLLPPTAIAGVSLVCALGPWVFSGQSVLRVTAAVAAATAAVGAAVMRRWDVEAGKRVADLTRARASDEWRHEERVAELETDLDESRELRTKLEHKLRAKRTELAGLRNEHAALLRRYATAETERASALEGRRLLEIETTVPEEARELPAAGADEDAGKDDEVSAASQASPVPPQGVPAAGVPWASWETASKAAAKAAEAVEAAKSAKSVAAPEGGAVAAPAGVAAGGSAVDGDADADEEDAGEDAGDEFGEDVGEGFAEDGEDFAEDGQGFAEDGEKEANPAVFSPSGSGLFLRANSALERIITQRGSEQGAAGGDGAAEAETGIGVDGEAVAESATVPEADGEIVVALVPEAETETASATTINPMPLPEAEAEAETDADAGVIDTGVEPDAAADVEAEGAGTEGENTAEPEYEPEPAAGADADADAEAASADEQPVEPVEPVAAEVSAERSAPAGSADVTAKGQEQKGPKGPSPKGDPDGPTDGGTRQGRSAEPAQEPVPVLTAEEDDAAGQSVAVRGHERATADPAPAVSAPPRSTGVGELTRVEPSGRALPVLPPTGHFTVPTAVAVVPAAPQRRAAVEGGFDFFGTEKGADALEAVQNEDLADVVGQEALALHKAESEARFKQADEASRGVGQVIDLTAHDETEQIDIQGLRTAAS